MPADDLPDAMGFMRAATVVHHATAYYESKKPQSRVDGTHSLALFTTSHGHIWRSRSDLCVPGTQWPEGHSGFKSLATTLLNEHRARKAASSAAPPSGSADIPPPSRLTVDLDRRKVVLDGTEHDVKSESALRWIKVLVERPGHWCSSAELEAHDKDLIGTRTDRLKQFLPEQVVNLIQSETGKGSRIRVA
jgi:hypothetical protein